MSFSARRRQRRPGGDLKHLLDAVASLGRALGVARRFDGPTQLRAFAGSHRALVARAAVRRAGVVSQVRLGPSEYDRRPRTEVANLVNPLERHVFKAVSVVDREADDDDVSVGVRQRT